MEAVIGAMYLDQGIKPTKIFITEEIINHLDRILADKTYQDPKSKFQEKAQELFGITPSYQVINESGPDHDKIFEVGVYLKDELVATGSGASKQEAQVAAAALGLEKKKW